MYIPFNYQNWRNSERTASYSALEEAEDWLLGDKKHFETRILSEIDKVRAAKRRSALKHKKAERRKEAGRDKRADYPPISQFIGRWSYLWDLN